MCHSMHHMILTTLRYLCNDMQFKDHTTQELLPYLDILVHSMTCRKGQAGGQVKYQVDSTRTVREGWEIYSWCPVQWEPRDVMYLCTLHWALGKYFVQVFPKLHTDRTAAGEKKGRCSPRVHTYIPRYILMYLCSQVQFLVRLCLAATTVFVPTYMICTIPYVCIIVSSPVNQ